jgi:hypothetical protein
MTTHAYRIAASIACAIALLFLASVGASAVGPGKTCDGIAHITCDPGLFCQHPAGRCGVIDGTGKCVKVPEVCALSKLKKLIVRPVCGCDGKTYGSDCERQMAKVSKNHNGKCKTP